ncbi:hypothetical protein [Sporichthya polymorpha]|uniref:hypothetical protein n=1 Tax=Sporichthya polymorpha TaxID=35751 RepID=UPI000381DEC6|nr:hypothetical protein [Sporichthya polymorpha]
MKRMFWTGLGVAAGVMVTRKASRALEQLTPAGISDRLAESITDLGDAVRQFGMDVREAMWDREDEIRDAFGLNDDTEPEPGSRATAR